MELEGTNCPAKEKSHVARCAGAELENGTNNFERKICDNGIHEDNKLQIDDHSLEVKTRYGIKEGWQRNLLIPCEEFKRCCS